MQPYFHIVNNLLSWIQAANYLNIKLLLDLTCQTVADMIKGKTPEEIRKTFNIKNDFTPEEEEEVRRENQWAFEWILERSVPFEVFSPPLICLSWYFMIVFISYRGELSATINVSSVNRGDCIILPIACRLTIAPSDLWKRCNLVSSVCLRSYFLSIDSHEIFLLSFFKPKIINVNLNKIQKS